MSVDLQTTKDSFDYLETELGSSIERQTTTREVLPAWHNDARIPYEAEGSDENRGSYYPIFASGIQDELATFDGRTSTVCSEWPTAALDGRANLWPNLTSTVAEEMPSFEMGSRRIGFDNGLGNHPCSYKSCGKTFARKDILMRHALTHKSPRYRCRYCQRGGVQKSFKRKDHLALHTRRMHPGAEQEELASQRRQKRKLVLSIDEQSLQSSTDDFQFECSACFVTEQPESEGNANAPSSDKATQCMRRVRSSSLKDVVGCWCDMVKNPESLRQLSDEFDALNLSKRCDVAEELAKTLHDQMRSPSAK